MHVFPFYKKQKAFKVLLDPKKQILKAFILIKAQPLNEIFS
ncbi:anti-sigma F factor antagonist [Lactobacillus helveticus]|uniref:Anti-sigma F factor antagonist n=1 Tax=Lactobacillus helveticus TaxID=1587 RepID=A0A6A7K1W4_LACHE|nr:anti-sigma F factor antagonist [Lactobacillus helveticus]